ncbi:hypothetical protein [Mangrovicella endophytica]|uniref:hypothetical protein n=1 Tax=Mangrovicella endophytica TaxID=2066697 RepID=UPI000C9DB253|nr:hypothetical protein [Mangrovicella endophytica]
MTVLTRAAAIAAVMVAAATLAGCGVKNSPVAPTTKVPPTVSREKEIARPADTSFRPVVVDPNKTGLGRGADITTLDEDTKIDAAEVARNRDAKKKTFFLDPLLN